MRKWLGLGALPVIGLLAWFAVASDGPPLEGDMAGWQLESAPAAIPDFTVSTPDGATLGPNDFAGSLIVMNFWATWCAPCVEEMPSLDRLQAAYDGKPLKVVAVSMDRGGARAVEPFFEKLELNALEIYLDPLAKVSTAFKARGLPTTLLIDAEGRLLGRFEGEAAWDSAEAKAVIDYYLADLTG